jgi:glycosyltransferase involved in cell wall biosynthesis
MTRRKKMRLKKTPKTRTRPAAVRRAGKAVLLAPDQPELHYARGLELLKSGAADQAVESLDRAIDFRVTYHEAQAALCLALERHASAEGRYPVSIITPTIGSPLLRRAINSVQSQSYAKLEHIIVVDGPQGAKAAKAAIPAHPRHPCHLVQLPFNTGRDGFNGHRIYGAAVFLVNSRYVAFLDEDNWFEPQHIALLMEQIESRGLEWSYALRNIVAGDGRFLMRDNCESLGRWPVWDEPGRHLVDMNCYVLRRDIAIALSPIFYRRVPDERSPDFILCQLLLERRKRFDTTGRFTVNYTVGSTPLSVDAAFFAAGNEAMRRRYRKRFPWTNEPDAPNFSAQTGF